jgi:hypothetical protein
MLHQVDDQFVISSHGVWVPGSYDSERAARYAFRFKNADLAVLSAQVNAEQKRPITFEDLRSLRSPR